VISLYCLFTVVSNEVLFKQRVSTQCMGKICDVPSLVTQCYCKQHVSVSTENLVHSHNTLWCLWAALSGFDSLPEAGIFLPTVTSVAHLASYPVGTEDPLFQDQVTRAWNWPLSCIWCQGLCTEVYLHSHICMHGTMLRHRNYFDFIRLNVFTLVAHIVILCILTCVVVW
jgi:hypothetical protein